MFLNIENLRVFESIVFQKGTNVMFKKKRTRIITIIICIVLVLAMVVPLVITGIMSAQ